MYRLRIFIPKKGNALLVLSCLCIVMGCTKKTASLERFPVKNVDSLALFTILTPKYTGITFANTIKESMYMNGLTYEYIYNGSGVSIGDLNNDGLEDIFLVSSFGKNELYLNRGNLKFRNTTGISNIEGAFGFSTGTTMVDIDHDGDLDIYVCKSGLFDDPDKRKNELYINQGTDPNGIPIFKEEAKKYNLDLPHQSTQAAFFDYDRDGDLDLFLLNHGTDPSYTSDVKKIPDLLQKRSPYQSNRLFRNDEGVYVDVSDSAGIIDNAISFGLGVAIGDVNNDGWPDVLVGQDYAEKDHLYINQGSGTFKEVIRQATNHISNFSMGNDMADFNNDGLLDFISVDMVSEHNYDSKTSMSGMAPERFYQLVDYGLHHQYMFNTLQLNNGIPNKDNVPVFSDVAQLAGVSNTDWSWAPLFFDMDNDGLKDLFISNGIKRDFRNNDYVGYKKKRLAQYVQDQKTTKRPKKLLEDYIRDLMGKIPKRNRDNLFFRNNGDLSFAKQNTNWNLNALTSTTGAAYADLDNDGDLDMVTNNVDDYSFIYRNNTNELKVGNNYIQFQLRGSEKNPHGIGTRIQIEHGNGQRQLLEKYPTRGFQSSVGGHLHFGVGTAEKMDKVVVQWPDGKEETLKSLDVNQVYTLHYKNAEVVPPKPLKVQQYFTDITTKSGIDFLHRENVFDDFEREGLLPHKMSQFGPALAVGDVNGDLLDDFYVGGALGYPGTLYVQKMDGTFQEDNQNSSLWSKEQDYEDTAALFLDVENDDDLDLYVVSGGNENNQNSKGLQDRLYLNNGKGQFSRYLDIPKIRTSGSVVKAFDYDGDGDQDLFIGGRQIPGKYPFPADSYVLRNDSFPKNIAFTDITKERAPELLGLGMVTDMAWIELNGDNRTDMVVVGEWMPITVFYNTDNGFIKATDTGLENHTGWWNSINGADFDKDGDIDLIAGNLGLNYKYKSSPEAPFEIYTKDFDGNGSLDIVLGYYEEGNLFPLRGRECSSDQVPMIKQKFPTYDLFAKASLEEVYGPENMEGALHYAATDFATSYLENRGDGTFTSHPLPHLAQLSATNTIEIQDFDQDGHLDVLLAGNLYGAEVETPRSDAGYGLLLTGNGKGQFKPIPPSKSGLYIPGDVKDSEPIGISGKEMGYVFAKNGDALQLIMLKQHP